MSDRRNATRLVTMALGIALTGLVVLALGSISPATGAIAARADALVPTSESDVPSSAAGSSFYAQPVSITVAGQHVSGYVLQGSAGRPAVPTGASVFPGPGQIVVSPALAARLRQSADLRAVIGGTIVGGIDPQVLGNPDSLYLYQGVELGRGTAAGDRANGWGIAVAPHPLDLRVWSVLITGVVVILVPLLLFTALAGRIGADRRDRRSALLRLLGASASRIRALVTAEAVLASIAGVALSFGAYGALRPLAPLVQIAHSGLRSSDVRPDRWAVATVFLAIPLLGVGAALVGSRQSAVGPLGVLTRIHRPPKLWWRLILLMATLAFTGTAVLTRGAGKYLGSGGPDEMVLVLCLIVVLALYTLAALVGWLTSRLAALAPAYGPAALLARRRIGQDGTGTTRAAAGLSTVLAGYIALTALLSTSQAQVMASDSGRTGYLGSVSSLSPAQWTRLDRSLSSAPGVTSVRLDAGIGASTDGTASVEVTTCAAIRQFAPGAACTDGNVFRVRREDGSLVPLDRVELGLSDGTTARWTPPAGVITLTGPPAAPDGWHPSEFVLTPAAAAAQFPGLLVRQQSVTVSLRMTPSSADAVQQAVSWLGWRGYSILEFTPLDNVTVVVVPWIRAGLIGAGLLTLAICALGQWLISSEQVRERRRALALARASGVPLGVLTRSVLLTALAPVLIGVLLAVPVGAGLAQVVQYLRSNDGSSGWQPLDWTSIAAGSGLSVLIAALVALGSAVQVRRATAPGALRTE